MKKTRFKEKNIDPVRIKELEMMRKDKKYVAKQPVKQYIDREMFFNRASVLRGSYLFPANRGPNTRTGSTLTRIRSKLYLFGGISTDKFNEMWVFDLSFTVSRR